jgi:dTDP-4-amino-4,6-dideoxygalactose transaminase
MGDEERSNLIDAFDSGWVSSAGPSIGAFEQALADFCDVPEVVAVSSGTAGLHLALVAAGVGPGDDVLVSTMTFAATGFAVVYTGATPHFVDCDPATWQIDVDLVEEELRARAARGRLPTAIISVDLFGSMADQSRLELLCAEYGVNLIEDAAEALGATLDGRSAGSFGRFGVFSFNGNKIVTTGGGGAVIASSPRDRSLIRRLSSQARTAGIGFEHDQVGFNYRITNPAAAIGIAQLRSLPKRIDDRAYVRYLYESSLGDVATFQADLPNSTSNRWLTTAVFPADVAPCVIENLREVGIESRPGFTPLHLLEPFRRHRFIGPGTADRIAAGMVSLPSSGRLTEMEVGEICTVTREAAVAQEDVDAITAMR